MLPRQRRGFFLSEYTIRVILLLVVSMIVIKFCTDMIDLRTENNPAIRSRNAVRGIADAIGEVDKCSPSGVPEYGDFNNLLEFTKKDRIILFGYSSDGSPSDFISPGSIDLKSKGKDVIVNNQLLEHINNYINNPDKPCYVGVPFSFDFDNWYFSINSREDPSDPSKSIAVASYYEKIPDGFKLDWTSGGDIKIENALLLDGGGINSYEINSVVELLRRWYLINLDSIGVIKVVDNNANANKVENLIIFVEGEVLFGGTRYRVRFIVT